MCNDHWETPSFVWHDLLKDVDRKLVLWDPFYCSGRSKIYMEDLGFEVIAPSERCLQATDLSLPCRCLSNVPNCDMLVTNPPFSKLESLLRRIFEIGKPSIVIMPTAAADAGWFEELVDMYGCDCLVEELPDRIDYIRNGLIEPNCGFDSCVLYIKMYDICHELQDVEEENEELFSMFEAGPKQGNQKAVSIEGHKRTKM